MPLLPVVTASVAGWALGLALFPQIGLWAVLVGFLAAGVGGLVVAAVSSRCRPW